MRILLSCYSCIPGRGSEPGLGWGVATLAGRIGEVVLLTAPVNQTWIEPATAELGTTEVIYVHLPRALSFLDSHRLHRLHYVVWQIFAYRVAKKLARLCPFDVAHHVTFCASWFPGFVALLPGGIWNAGGTDVTPWRFLRKMSIRSALRELVRVIIVRGPGSLVRRWMSGRAKLILSPSAPTSFGASAHRVKQWASGGLPRVELEALGESALDDEPGDRLRMLSVGALQGLKGLGLALDAFAGLVDVHPSAKYWIVGDGPERGWLMRRITRLGLGDAVRLLGDLPREKVLALYREADILVQLSFHEQFGYAVLEGMAAGLPVICLDQGGPSTLLTHASGILIAPVNTRQVTTQVTDQLLKLARDPLARRSMGEKAAEAARGRWAWDQQESRYREIYLAAARG